MASPQEKLRYRRQEKEQWANLQSDSSWGQPPSWSYQVPFQKTSDFDEKRQELSETTSQSDKLSSKTSVLGPRLQKQNQLSESQAILKSSINDSFISQAMNSQQAIPDEYVEQSRTEIVTHQKNDHVSANDRNHREFESDENNVQGATNKMVKWLRNRFRKRFKEGLDLKQAIKQEKLDIQKLEEEIETASSERHEEIRLKLKNQRKLRDFRLHANEPDEDIETIKRETVQLSQQLQKVKLAHGKMFDLHEKLIAQLHEAGLSHWIEVRGKQYLPETAAGILSKSVDLLSPVSHGIERVVDLDRKLSSGFEHMVPLFSREALPFSVLDDIVMLLPFLPFCFLGMQLPYITRIISMHETVLGSAFCLLIVSITLLIVSIPLGQSALVSIYTSSPPIGTFCTGIMTTLSVIMAVGQSRIAMRLSMLGEYALAILAIFTCYPLAICFGRRSAVGMPITAHVAHIAAYGMLALERKRSLGLSTPWDETVDNAVASIRSWINDTFQAMKNVFKDDFNHYENGSTIGDSLSCLSIMSSLPTIPDPPSPKPRSPPPRMRRQVSRRENRARRTTPPAQLEGAAGEYARWLNGSQMPTSLAIGHGKGWYSRNIGLGVNWRNPRQEQNRNIRLVSEDSIGFMSCRDE